MLTITFSNRFETLFDRLLKRMGESSASPLAPEGIVVPSAAIRRKLELEIADCRGVCANVNFSFLGAWVLEQSLPTVKTHAFSTEVLAWQIFRILSDEGFVLQHTRLSSWLSKTHDAAMRFDLAQRIAPLLEQYALYRPEWLIAWANCKQAFQLEAGSPEAQDHAWQAALWRRIIDEHDSTHPWVEMYQWLDSRQTVGVAGSETSIFCPPAIAPLYITALHRLAQTMDIHLYLLNPCREYWSDLVGPRHISYLEMQDKLDYHESGNPLLAAWGMQTQSMLKLLADSNDEEDYQASHESGHPPRLLAHIQDAILDMAELDSRSLTLDDGDRSLEVHVCHSLARELEVLQDQLLSAFASDKAFKPEDILVVTPDLEQAAPLIDAIFGTAQTERKIPYSISGRKSSRENPVAKALLDLLALMSSRFPASDVFNLLRQPLVARKFGLKEADLGQIHDWMHDSGIRWGLDADHRSRFGLPESERYSFRDGLHRLFLGYALPVNAGEPCAGRLPVGNAEGSQASALGSFWHFMMQLEAMCARFEQPQTPEQWLYWLGEMTQLFMQPVNNELDDMRDTRKKMHELCQTMRNGCGTSPVPLEVMQKVLIDHLDNTASAAIPVGTVTFAPMHGLRNLPYRMICVIGLNDGAFPSTQRPAEFDLMAKPGRMRAGDRQRGNDERNLFLDLLLAARERFYLSYTGRGVRDNAEKPPSVLVSDLLDYVLPIIDADNSQARERLIVEHPLQPFSLQSYLDDSDPRIWSSRKSYFDGLKAKQDMQSQPLLEVSTDVFDDEEAEEFSAEYAQRFFSKTLPPLDETWRDVSLEQLIAFFRNPSRYLLRYRMGIYFPEQPEELQDEEPFLPEREENNALADRLLPQMLEGASMSEIENQAAAGNEYPPGKLGDTLLHQEVRNMFDYAREWQFISAQSTLPGTSQTLSFEIAGESWNLSGFFNDLRADGLMRHRYDQTRPVDYLSGWIQHLFLNAIAPEDVTPCTTWLSRDGQYRLHPVANAHEALQQLLELYRQGLAAPLPFYPKSAWAYITGKGGLKAAHGKWKNNWDEDFGEEKQPDFKQALRGTANPLNADFEACARQVFAPLLQHIEDDRLKISKEAEA